MTIAEARAIAQSDPGPNLVTRWGQQAAETRASIDALISHFRELDKTQTSLGEHGHTVSVDLGPVGNQAFAAWRTTQEHAGKHEHDFALPRAV